MRWMGTNLGSDGSTVQDRVQGATIAAVDNLHIGSYGLAATVLGYMLMVKIGNAYRRNDVFLSNPRDLTGCTLVFLAQSLMLGGVGTMAYAAIQFARSRH
jgi:hypothetical protein